MRIQIDCNSQRNLEVFGDIVSPRNDREATPMIPQQYGYLYKAGQEQNQ